jgi:hypothetical protein
MIYLLPLFGKHLEKAGRQKLSLKQKKKGHV